jgi:DNA polymerase I-like protein with 3'-5' exonuclease and polymerase domains
MRVAIVTESLARVPRMDLLWDALDRAGLPRASCDVVAAVPEDARDCKRRQITAGRDQLHRALRGATAVMLVGNVPLEAITDKKGIKQKRGRPWEENGRIYLPVMPPGAAAYDEKVLPMLEADMRLFADIARKGKIPREEGLDYTIVDSRETFDEMLADLKGTVSFDIETTGLNPWAEERRDDNGKITQREAHVVSIGFGTKDKQWCLPFGHPEFLSFGLSRESMMARIDRRMRECYLVAHNGKFDSVYLRVHFGVDWRPDFDTMLAHWMLDENQRHGLKLLAQVYFGAPNYDADLDEKQGIGPIDKHCLYLAHDVYYTRRLRMKFAKLFEQDHGVRQAFERIVMPVARIFCGIEFHGVLVDYDRFEEVEVHLRDQLKLAQKELNKSLVDSGLTEEEALDINWRSPKQIAELFFDRLKIPPIPVKKKKGGVNNRSTAETVLKQFTHPVAAALMKFRGTDQQLKMFIDGWRPFLVEHEDGWRLHPSFKLHGTVTGRASCEHPNLQQVPRDPVIRSLIIAPDGWDLVEVDLSQIEMRLAAELSGDPTLLGIFQRDEDVHWRTMIRSIQGSGGGEYLNACIRTASVHLMRHCLPPDRAGAEAVLAVRNPSPSRSLSDRLLQMVCEKWKNNKAWRREWRGTDGAKELAVAGWCKQAGIEKIPGKLLSGLRSYGEALHSRGISGSNSASDSPQGREPKKQSSLEFSYALQVLSHIHPSEAEGIDSCWKEARKKAKAVGFGFLFGMWWRKFVEYARDNYGIIVSENEAQQVRKDFFSTYRELGPWHERQKRYARRHGHVRSLSGALRRLPDAMSNDDTPARAEALRQAINSPVQRFACELNFMALLQICDEFGWDVVRPIATVHDATMIEVRHDHTERVYVRMLEIMEGPSLLSELGIRLKVPVKGDGKIGPWSKGVSLAKWKAKSSNKQTIARVSQGRDTVVA